MLHFLEETVKTLFCLQILAQAELQNGSYGDEGPCEAPFMMLCETVDTPPRAILFHLTKEVSV